MSLASNVILGILSFVTDLLRVLNMMVIKSDHGPWSCSFLPLLGLTEVNSNLAPSQSGDSMTWNTFQVGISWAFLSSNQEIYAVVSAYSNMLHLF